MNEPQSLAPPSPVAGLNARIGLIGQRQEQLAQVVAELGGSVSDFDQLRTYVEQIAGILASLAKEVGAYDLDGVERRLDEVGRVTLEIETLRQETREIAAIVGELAQRRATAPAPPPAPWWPDLPAGPEREEAVQNLGLWVDEVLRARHPEAYNELGTCWFQHPDILDELTALRAAWFAAYRDPGAPPMAPIEWHDHWLPATMTRCKAIIRARGCKARHQKQPDSTTNFLDRHRNFDASSRRPAAGPAPVSPGARALVRPAAQPLDGPRRRARRCPHRCHAADGPGHVADPALGLAAGLPGCPPGPPPHRRCPQRHPRARNRPAGRRPRSSPASPGPAVGLAGGGGRGRIPGPVSRPGGRSGSVGRRG